MQCFISFLIPILQVSINSAFHNNIEIFFLLLLKDFATHHMNMPWSFEITEILFILKGIRNDFVAHSYI